MAVNNVGINLELLPSIIRRMFEGEVPEDVQSTDSEDVLSTDSEDDSPNNPIGAILGNAANIDIESMLLVNSPIDEVLKEQPSTSRQRCPCGVPCFGPDGKQSGESANCAQLNILQDQPSTSRQRCPLPCFLPDVVQLSESSTSEQLNILEEKPSTSRQRCPLPCFLPDVVQLSESSTSEQKNVLEEKPSTSLQGYLSGESSFNPDDMQMRTFLTCEKSQVFKKSSSAPSQRHYDGEQHHQQATKESKNKRTEDIEDSDRVNRLLHLSCSDKISEFRPSSSHRPSNGMRKKEKKKWTREAYTKARDTIYSKISFLYNTCIIVWVPLVCTRVELIYTLLPKFGDIVIMHDRWIQERKDSKERWGGVLVVYSTSSEAEMAAKEIPRKYKFVKTLRLSHLLHCLIKSQLQLFALGRTDVFINVPRESQQGSLEQLRSLFHAFGHVIPEDCYEVTGQFSIRYKITYRCAAYAFLAMTVLDGLPFGSSKLKVEVNETKRETAILKDLTFHLQKYTDNAAFLFKGLW